MITDRPRAEDLAPTDWDLVGHIAKAQRLSLLTELLRLDPLQWDLPTDVPGWTITDLVAHVTEIARGTQHPLRFIARAVSGRHAHRDKFAAPGPERAIQPYHDLSIDELLAEYRHWTDAARTPDRWRWLPVPFTDLLPADATLGYVIGTLVPRDVYLHRLDVGAVTGNHVDTDPTDSEVIAQLVRDFGRSWSGPPMILRLTGMSGGAWLVGNPEADARVPVASVSVVDFMRQVTGRRVRLDAFDHLPEPILAPLLATRIGC
ncbi:maleylpyruvate isomerase family mycothiol-dependent enzyme [Granulicoccus phenolivorans]|uniref:maleylpyruvate isomerase family mycothiol-dependent enzyme n=1 Tax=Granulicoccus phenolivorans TaxID=266854 RepID=UPI000408DE82|nr:maleylpyruvate isomerase family mycothiol-dependent enzyme [Granulicoccus phenolivorans]